jgi:superfamily I DNA and/or RNA helicase
VQSGNGAAEVQHNFGGKSNPTEAELVARIVSDLIAAGDVDDRTVAVISPYSKQVQLIRTELGNIQNARNVRVGTVDSFQGQETDVVVFSAVRSNPMKEMGFLRDSRRLCVGITRARRGLILVGDRSVLNSCRHWAALLESCERRGCTMEARDFKQQRVPEELSIEEGSPIYDDRELMDLLDEAEDEHGLFSPASSSPEALR